MEIGSIDSSDWKEGGDAIDTTKRFLDHLEKNILKEIEMNVGKFNGGDRIGSVPDKVTTNFRLKFKADYNWVDLLRKIQNEAQLFANQISLKENFLQFCVIFLLPINVRNNSR